MPELDWQKLNSVALAALRELRNADWSRPTWHQVCAYNYLAIDVFEQASSYGVPDPNLVSQLTPSAEQYKALEKVSSVASGGALPRDWQNVEKTAGGYLGGLRVPLQLSEAKASSQPATHYASLADFVQHFQQSDANEYQQLQQDYKTAYGDTSLTDGGDYDGVNDPLDPGADSAPDSDPTESGSDIDWEEDGGRE